MTNDTIHNPNSATPLLPVSNVVTGTRSLLIFDVNGLFVERKHRSELRKTTMPRTHDFVTRKNLCVYIRPHTREFLEFVFEHFDVGFWSSMTKENMYDILTKLLTSKQVNATKIVLTQDDCRMTGEYVENTKKPVFYKVLDWLWTKAEIQTSRLATSSYRNNVLLIDDSPHKAKFNPPHTAIHPTTYTLFHLEPEDTELLRLQSYLEGSLNASSLRTYVRDNPYDETFSMNQKSECSIDNEKKQSWVSVLWRSLYLLWCRR